jgi:hypothetical protein
MTNDRKPAPPADLGGRGRKFWRATVAAFELSAVEMELLVESCRLLDECEALRSAVDRDGATVAGSSGQVRVNPAIGELRQHRLALGRLLAQLALPDVDDRSLATPRTASARTATAARWKGHTPHGTPLRGVDGGTA